MKRIKLTLAVITVMAFLVFPTVTFAQEAGPPVCVFYGKVILNGKPVPDGTEVVALINGKEVARCTTIDSKYGYKANPLRIWGNYDGKKVSFKVAGLPAGTAIWVRGKSIKFDLIVGKRPVVASPPSPFSYPSPLGAPPVGPAICGFFGEVTFNGKPAPNGTEVIALIEGKKVASTTTVDSKYGYKDNPLRISGDYDGKKVTFKIKGVPAAETATWERGGYIRLNLSPKVVTTEVKFRIQLLGAGKIKEEWRRYPIGGRVGYYLQPEVKLWKGFGILPLSAQSEKEGPVVNVSVELPAGACICEVEVGIGGWGIKLLDVKKAFGKPWAVPLEESVIFPGKFVFQRTGDSNMDGVVDVSDLAVVGKHLNQSSEGAWKPEKQVKKPNWG